MCYVNSLKSKYLLYINESHIDIGLYVDRNHHREVSDPKPICWSIVQGLDRICPFRKANMQKFDPKSA